MGTWSLLFPDLYILSYRGDTGVTVVVFSDGTVLFANPKSEVDPFPTVAGSSAVVGVLAFIWGENPVIPAVKVMVANMQTNSINLEVYILLILTSKYKNHNSAEKSYHIFYFLEILDENKIIVFFNQMRISN